MVNRVRYFYTNDGSTDSSPSCNPANSQLDHYQCPHGLSYSPITGAKHGLEADVLYFVPLKSWCEVQIVKLTNTGSSSKSFKLFSFMEWCLWNAEDDQNNLQRNLSTGEVEICGSTIYHKTEYKDRRDHYAFYHANTPVQGRSEERRVGKEGSALRR